MESQVWLQARSGDVDAIGQVIEATQRIALAAARRRGSVSGRTDPEDAAQVALVKAFEALVAGKFADSSYDDFKSYMDRKGRCCATQEIRRHLAKKRSANRQSCDIDSLPAKHSPTAAIEAYEQIAAMLQSFEGREYYEEIVRMLAEGYTRPEIQVALNITTCQLGCRIKQIHAWAKKLAA